jgi:hypothetical protein
MEMNCWILFLIRAYAENLLTWVTWWLISVGPGGSSLEMLLASVASARIPLISLESLLGGCKHSVSVPSVGIFESNHRVTETDFLMSWGTLIQLSTTLWE